MRDQTEAEGSVKRLDWLDAIRGFAIIGVIGSHLRLLLGGGNGVQLFFVASAIALLHSWNAHQDGANRFYLRRLFRITPMFWLSIPLFYGLSVITGAVPSTLDQIFASAFFLHWVTPQWQNSAVPGSWSIACEVLFYAGFPLLVTQINSFNKSVIALVASIIVAAAAWPALIAYAGQMGALTIFDRHGFAFYSITTQLPCFLAGFCVYFAARQSWPAYWGQFSGLVGLAILVLAFGLRLQSAAYYLVYCLAFALVAHALATGHLAFLKNRIVIWTGLISYSAYFWQFVWIDLARSAEMANPWMSIFVISATLATSALTYLIVEKPMIRLGAALARGALLSAALACPLCARTIRPHLPLSAIGVTAGELVGSIPTAPII